MINLLKDKDYFRELYTLLSPNTHVLVEEIQITMFYVHKGLRFMLGIFLFLAGANHFLQPTFYIPIIPAFLPFKLFVIAASGWVEVILGIGLFVPKVWRKAAWGIVGLFTIYVLVHILDFFRENPAIGSHQVALIRLLVQGIFIGWAWFVARYRLS